MTVVFEAIAVFAGLKVITEKNTVHSVFYLVLAFINSAIILITWGIDYIGLLIIIVYVGAIAILFIFVVMMINVKNEETTGSAGQSPSWGVISAGVIVTMILMGEVYLEYPKMLSVKTASQTAIQINGASDFVGGPREAGWVGGNIETIGGIMYGWEIIMYGAMVLLVAMIGAIVLTISHTPGVRRQDLFGADIQ